jgi:hypothetical protein
VYLALPSLPNNFVFTGKIRFTPLLEGKTERFAANYSRSTSQNPLAWPSNPALESFQST